MLSLLRERDEVRIVADQIGAPTWASEIAQATAAIVEAAVHERAEGRFASDLFNLTASGATSWYGFATAILADAMREDLVRGGPTPRIVPVTSDDYPRPAARPKNSRLTGDRLRRRFGVALPAWDDGLRLCLAEMRKEVVA
jgi:dTDP-4-dehydrorhamnose reductase